MYWVMTNNVAIKSVAHLDNNSARIALLIAIALKSS